MKRRGLPVAAWGAFILVLSAAALPFHPDTMTTVLGFGAGAAAVATGLTLFHTERRPAPGLEELERVPALSFPTPILAIGFTVAVVGAEVGTWMVGIGLGLMVAGAAGVARETAA